MSDKYFVDTNILIYAHDPSWGLKHSRGLELIEDLWHSGQGVLSTQVLQEFCVNIRRKTAHPIPFAKLRLLVRNYSTWEVVINTSQSVLKALEIEERFKISFWDALILQAAEEADASILYSEDLAAGQHFGAVQVINPFADLNPTPPSRRLV